MALLGVCALAAMATCSRPAPDGGLETEEEAGPPGAPSSVPVGQSFSDPAMDVTAGYADVVTFSTSLEGDTLAAVFELREPPPELTGSIDTVDLMRDQLEVIVRWQVNVTLHGETTTQEPDYVMEALLMAAISADPDEPTRVVATGTVNKLAVGEDGVISFQFVGDLEIEIDAASGTVTLRGRIPDLTGDALVTFETIDYRALDGLADTPG